MRIKTKIFLATLLLLPALLSAQDRANKGEIILPSWGIKTNLLHDATTSPNLGLEFRTGRKTSLDVSASYKPWTFSDQKNMRHLLAQPEFRWWTRETFNGHFFGLHGHYAFYNWGNMPDPPFSDYMNKHRFVGWLAGGGLSYGYRWNFDHRWALEATVGAGYAYMEHDKYECGTCDKLVAKENTDYFGPTRAGITLIYGIGGKRVPPPPPAPVVVAPPPPPPPIVIYEPKLSVSYTTPEVEEVKARSSEVSKSYLAFNVGRSDIVTGLGNNAAELQKIYDLVRQVQNDPDATITGISVTGFASPEGSYASNMTLSQNRAQSLKNHIRSRYSFPENLFTVQGMGEDWTTLDSLVSVSNISNKSSILDIIRSTDVFDGREKKLMDLAGGNPYRQMLNEMFPLLRRVEGQIHFTVVPFTVEKGKEVFLSRPGNLSLNEMFLIANTYEPGSASFNQVFETAARLFPQNDVANLNAAANSLEQKEITRAARYLDSVKEQNVAYWNNLGVLMWLQGNKEKAAENFAKGGAQGAVNAAELNKHFQSINAR